MNKPKLDLSHDKCHVCHSPLMRNIETQMDKCINPLCLIRNIDFSIPFIVEKNKT